MNCNAKKGGKSGWALDTTPLLFPLLLDIFRVKSAQSRLRHAGGPKSTKERILYIAARNVANKRGMIMWLLKKELAVL